MEVTRACSETHYIPTNVHSFHMLHTNDALQQNKVPMLQFFLDVEFG
jgi:hypothetical protein